MRFTTLIAALLLGACAEPHLETAPRTTVAISDLALHTTDGRAKLRQRVAAAAHRICDLDGREITPAESREDPYYCPDMMRSEIMYAMQPDVRRAYAQARREAGVQGRNL